MQFRSYLSTLSRFWIEILEETFGIFLAFFTYPFAEFWTYQIPILIYIFWMNFSPESFFC